MHGPLLVLPTFKAWLASLPITIILQTVVVLWSHVCLRQPQIFLEHCTTQVDLNLVGLSLVGLPLSQLLFYHRMFA